MPAALKLVNSRTSTTGVTANSYRRDGEIGPGTFELVEQPRQSSPGASA